ncbi:MAG: hypothetical protein HON98_04220 [Chloroflexi bacterium]|jgi:hypothetical protein|nr:hypothetical protein [Chloroflexota bacterium]MBT3671257.1 hypothetical protein [Chloroflexota bacterium]MBT4004351.1 hypothetical protein [Chloroflexota bacterium]MBT4304284.1 hypothetical protein [Chloroflexota bacterium]MBT4534303.1 hypothetical protein [Chloroflexota bacterium]
MSGITKTIPQKHGQEAVDSLYEGGAGEFEFHMAGKPSRLAVGDYVYTIWKDMLVGRLKITRIETGAVNPMSGKPRSLIYVEIPGKRIGLPVPRQGHRGTRYYDGADWN